MRLDKFFITLMFTVVSTTIFYSPAYAELTADENGNVFNCITIGSNVNCTHATPEEVEQYEQQLIIKAIAEREYQERMDKARAEAIELKKIKALEDQTLAIDRFNENEERRSSLIKEQIRTQKRQLSVQEEQLETQKKQLKTQKRHLATEEQQLYMQRKQLREQKRLNSEIDSW